MADGLASEYDRPLLRSTTGSDRPVAVIRPNSSTIRKQALTVGAFVGWAKEHDLKLMFIQPSKPNQNAFVERFNRRFRQDVLDAWLFNAVSEVQTAANEWVDDYNELHPHDALDSVPPAVFKARMFNQEVSTSGLST